MSAVISECGRYRYRLRRDLDGDAGYGTLLFVMLNPSTADASADDPTIRKCKGFAQRLGYRAINVVNLYAWRATDPREILKAEAPVGPDNDHHIAMAMGTASRVIVAWGTNRAAKERLARLESIRAFMAAGAPIDLWCLGVTKDGSPWHPLMRAYDTPLEPWTMERLRPNPSQHASQHTKGRPRSANSGNLNDISAKEVTRTPTAVKPLAPEAS